ncbi:hypothetical protein ACN47E_006784 [Coniothyrium glycines]
MQLTTLLSAAASVAFASASGAVVNTAELNKSCNKNEAYARVINRCDYDVHVWSVKKGAGCPVNSDSMVTLKKGEVYNENYQVDPDNVTGVSIKISKTTQCKGNDIVQLEYFLEKNKPDFNYNYLDVSYVDCLGGDCPTKSEGYYMVAGNQTGRATASAANTWCPILACHDAVSCAKCSYILPDDVQTKTCDHDSNMDFYMCGGDAPTEDYGSAPAPASSNKAGSSKPAPTPSEDDSYKAKAAAVTPVAIKDADNYGQKTRTKVEVVYVTAYEYVNAKRHAHNHARRHANFHA